VACTLCITGVPYIADLPNSAPLNLSTSTLFSQNCSDVEVTLFVEEGTFMSSSQQLPFNISLSSNYIMARGTCSSMEYLLQGIIPFKFSGKQTNLVIVSFGILQVVYNI
jgi:hypothetical protein